MKKKGVSIFALWKKAAKAKKKAPNADSVEIEKVMEQDAVSTYASTE
jgi:hypothetical protein